MLYINYTSIKNILKVKQIQIKARPQKKKKKKELKKSDAPQKTVCQTTTLKRTFMGHLGGSVS